MNLKGLTRAFGKVKIKAIQKAPEIFMIAGIAGTVTGTVIACKKTKNVEGILEEHKQEVEELKSHASETPMSDYRKEMAKIYATTGFKVVRNYALPGSIMLASVGSILYGHRILSKRYATTCASLAAMTKDYNNLYENVKKEVGEERAKELKYGIETETVEEEIVDKNGKVKKVKKEVKKVGEHGSSFVLRWNANTADEWVNDIETNMMTVNARKGMLENRIATRETGHLFWWEAVQELFGSKGLNKVIKDRKAKNLPVPILAGYLFDPDKSENVPIDVYPDPENESGLLISIIPDCVITELGKFDPTKAIKQNNFEGIIEEAV